jgi:hypothetical protein
MKAPPMRGFFFNFKLRFSFYLDIGNQVQHPSQSRIFTLAAKAATGCLDSRCR